MKDMYELMGACNGEIRIQAVRYGSGFMCLISIIEQEDAFWEHFTDMICGDNDYFDAREILESRDMQKENSFTFAYGDTPQQAFENAHKIALEDYNNFCAEKGIV